MRSRLACTALVCAALALSVTGCGSSSKADEANGSDSNGSVPVVVRRSAAGGVVVLVPVYINGHGPYRFIIDTGASRSVIDDGLARSLGLPISPSHALLTGVNATRAAGRVSISHWRVGRVALPHEQVLTLSLAADQRGPHLGGLIGSDNLSRFGSFTLDYADHRLELH